MAFIRCGMSGGGVKLPDTFSIQVRINGTATAQHDTGNRTASLSVSWGASGTIQLGDYLYSYSVTPTSFSGSDTNTVSRSGTATITFKREET